MSLLTTDESLVDVLKARLVQLGKSDGLSDLGAAMFANRVLDDVRHLKATGELPSSQGREGNMADARHTEMWNDPPE